MTPIMCFFVIMVGDDIVLCDLVCDYESWSLDDEHDDLLGG